MLCQLFTLRFSVQLIIIAMTLHNVHVMVILNVILEVLAFIVHSCWVLLADKLFDGVQRHAVWKHTYVVYDVVYDFIATVICTYGTCLLFIPLSDIVRVM